MRIVAVFVWCLVLSTSAAMAATLNVAILQPKPVITSLDAVKLSASTNELVFSSTAFRIISSFSRNGNDILWDIRSEPTFNQGAAIVLEMYHSNTLNPLPSGDYRLQVNWAHTGSGTIPGAPRSGQGVLAFSVVAPPIRPGDFNQDGVVDGADFLLWQQQADGGEHLQADGNGDLVVDGLDLDVWKIAAASGTNSASAVTAVPEPAALALASLAASLFAQRKKRLSQASNA